MVKSREDLVQRQADGISYLVLRNEVSAAPPKLMKISLSPRLPDFRPISKVAPFLPFDGIALEFHREPCFPERRRVDRRAGRKKYMNN